MRFNRFIREENIDESVIKKIKRVWTMLKAKIKGVISSTLSKLGFGDEVVITIPGLKNEDRIEIIGLSELLNEGALEAIKGNYNEALTCQYITNYDGKNGVYISKKYKKYISQIDKLVSEWDAKLKVAIKNYSNVINIIKIGSIDMSNYLIGTVLSEKGTIIGVWVDNLTFQEGVEFKGDIKLAVMKGNKEKIRDYSLKIYGTKSISLANSSPAALAGHLVGPKAKKEVENLINKDKDLLEMIRDAKESNKELKFAKKSGDDDYIDDMRMLRYDTRHRINPILAKILFDVLKPYEKEKLFGKNLLKLIGFTDKDTKILTSIVTKAGKHVILDEHPELDLSNIKLQLSGVSINVIGPTGKTIVSFGIKEGEQKKLSGKVSFASVKPADISKYNYIEFS